MKNWIKFFLKKGPLRLTKGNLDYPERQVEVESPQLEVVLKHLIKIEKFLSLKKGTF